MAQTPTVVKQDGQVDLGAVSIPATDLLMLDPKDANARGIVLNDARAKVLVENPDSPGHFIAYTLSLYIQREAIDEQELTRIHNAATERDTKQNARKADEQNKREREIARAQQLGQESIISAMRNLNTLSQASAVLGALNGGK